MDYYLSNKFVFLRFNFRTGDAAGMNMVGKATFAACNWILQNFDGATIGRFYPSRGVSNRILSILTLAPAQSRPLRIRIGAIAQRR